MMRFLVLLMLGLAVAAPVPASAQTAEVCEGVGCTAAEPVGRACRIFFQGDGVALNRFNIGGFDRYDVERPDGCLQPGQVYGLQGFRMHWPGGHKVARFAIHQAGGGFQFFMRDARGIDPAQAFVWLVPLPPGTELRETRCQFGCVPLVPPIPRDKVYVIAGFDFKKPKGDGHLESFLIDTTFVGSGQLGAVFRDKDRWNSVRIIQYAVVDRSALAGNATISGSYTRDQAGELRKATAEGDAVLTKLSFKFGNGGHFIEDIGLERSRFSYEAWFQDDQSRADRRTPDDPFDWEAQFRFLR